MKEAVLTCTCHIMERCRVSTPHLDRREWPAAHFNCYTYHICWITGWTGLGSHTHTHKTTTGRRSRKRRRGGRRRKRGRRRRRRKKMKRKK